VFVQSEYLLPHSSRPNGVTVCQIKVRRLDFFKEPHTELAFTEFVAPQTVRVALGA
jgi:hypothetical protein